MSSLDLSYVLVTPHTLRKSRTGGVLNRLLARTGLDLVGAMLFAPDDQMVREYTEAIPITGDEGAQRVRGMIREYVSSKFSPDPVTGRKQRVMALLLRGEKAVERTREVVGRVRAEFSSGQTIRDTFGDYILDATGENVVYFEPAVLCPTSEEGAVVQMQLLARSAQRCGGVLSGVLDHGAATNVERTLVLIKPDNFEDYPKGRPGQVVDLFSSSGVSMVGIKVHRMTVVEAQTFYAPVRETLLRVLGPEAGAVRFRKLVEFMSGVDPETCPPSRRGLPGPAKVLAIAYEGPDAIVRVRSVLGATDPDKAAAGTIRREFGESMLVNAAHASDSQESAAREMAVMGMEHNVFVEQIESSLAKLGRLP
jgi:nucleoside diphosphate kinase